MGEGSRADPPAQGGSKCSRRVRMLVVAMSASNTFFSSAETMDPMVTEQEAVRPSSMFATAVHVSVSPS
jgi:hypothetical protein